LYQRLLDVYESGRFRWAEFKIISRPTDYSKRDELYINDYRRDLELASNAAFSKMEEAYGSNVITGINVLMDVYSKPMKNENDALKALGRRGQHSHEISRAPNPII
jgi:hypothetical protein